MLFSQNKSSLLFLLLLLVSPFAQSQAQTPNSPLGNENASALNVPKVGWYFSAGYSAMFHSDHIGNAVSAEAGIAVLKRKLQIGIIYYGRSGPINPQEYVYQLPEGTEYKGQSELTLRADHGAFGIALTPRFPVAKGKLSLEFPFVFGQIGAGFYLLGDDRNTPDGRRVSEWENELMNNADAGFGLLVEGGVRVATPIAKSGGIEAGFGLHYTMTPGWETTVGGTNFYNIPRASIFLRFGN